jgi:hypothetical protein
MSTPANKLTEINPLAAQDSAKIETEVQLCVAYLSSRHEDEQRPNLPNLSDYINTAHDDNDNSLLHLAVETRSAARVEWLLENGADVNVYNKAGIFPYGLKAALALPSKTLQKLLTGITVYESKTLGLQLSGVCERAILQSEKELLTLCLPLLLETKHPHFTLNDSFAVNANQSLMPWFCMNPNSYEMLESFHELYCSIIESDTSLLIEIDNITCRPEAKVGSIAFQQFLQTTHATKVTLLELALLNGNFNAAHFLFECYGIQTLQHYHTHQFLSSKQDPKRLVALFNFVVNLDAPALISEEGSAMLSCLIKNMFPPELVALGMLNSANVETADKIPECKDLQYHYDSNTTYSEVEEFKLFMQHIIITYLARTYEGKNGHGGAGVKCAQGLLARVLAADSIEQIDLAVANLLLQEPKKTLQTHSLRALIIRSFAEAHNSLVAPFALPAEPWNKALQLRVGLLLRIQAVVEGDDSIKHFITAVWQGTRGYLLQNDLTEKGLEGAISRWEALALTFNNLQSLLKALESTLKKGIGTTQDEHSHRGHLIKALVTNNEVCALIGYKSDVKKSDQDNLVKTLEIYRNSLNPVVSKASLLRDTKEPDSDKSSGHAPASIFK